MKKLISTKFGYELKVIVDENGTVYTKSEKRNVHRASNCNGVTGAKLEMKRLGFFANKSVDAWLSEIEAQPKGFKGSPAGVK